MTLLELVQTFCRRQGLPAPSIAVSSQDDQILQIVGLADEVAEDLVRRHSWTALIREATFTSVSGGDQGSITTLADTGFLKVLNDTIFDRTRRLPVFGPRSPQEWQAIKAVPMSGPFYQYRFRGDHLLITPDMPSGHSMAFEYMSQAYVLAANGTTYKTSFSADDDTFLLDPVILRKGLRWKWREAKGLPYAEDFRAYEAAVAEAMGADGTKPVLSMHETYPAVRPGIFVPAGNWNVTP